MLRHVPHPLYAGGLEADIRVEAASDGAVDDGLLLLLQQLDQLLLGVDVAPDPPVRVVEEANNSGLFWEGWKRDRHSAHELPISARHLRPEGRAVDCVNNRFRSKQSLNVGSGGVGNTGAKNQELTDAYAVTRRPSDLREIWTQLSE